MSRIRVEFEGRTIYPMDLEIDELHDKAKKALVKALTKGKFYDEEAEDPSEALSGILQRRLTAAFLGTYEDRPRPGQRPESGPTRWVIPGLWRWGYIPMLGGNPKAGKSTLAVELLAAVMNGTYQDETHNGHRFLDYFDPTEIAQKELWDRPVWYINAENPPDALEESMVAADLGDWIGNSLVVEHLEYLGGAHEFDLTDADRYQWWEVRFTTAVLEGFFGEDATNTPLLVIVDGLTAILGGSTAKYGEWYAAFRRLLKSLGIPNALVIAHSTLEGGHLMGGVEAQAGSDGNWNLQRKGSKKRLFSVDARMGGVSIDGLEVRLDPDSRLRAGGNRPAVVAISHSPTTATTVPSEPDSSSRDLQAEVLIYVHHADAQNLQPSGNMIREAIPGRNPDIDAAVSDLVQNGLLDKYKRTLQGGGFAYRLMPEPKSDFVPPPPNKPKPDDPEPDRPR